MLQCQSQFLNYRKFAAPPLSPFVQVTSTHNNNMNSMADSWPRKYLDMYFQSGLQVSSAMLVVVALFVARSVVWHALVTLSVATGQYLQLD